MVRAVKRTVLIQPGGRIEVSSTELPEGRPAEVIILVEQEAPVQRRPDVAPQTSSPSNNGDSWESHRAQLAACGFLVLGAQKKSARLLNGPTEPGPAGVLEALLRERQEDR